MSLAALCSYTFVLAVQSVSEVPDPRPAALVVDQAGVLDAAAEQRLNTVLLATRDQLGPTVAVVAVDDVPGTPKEFATALFNHWQLGSAAKNDGVLVLLVMGKRRLEVETGTGIEPALPAWWLSEMQAAKMVPRFKQGAFGDGLEQGVMAMAQRLGALPGEGERDTAPGEYHSNGVPAEHPTGGVNTAMPPGGGGPRADVPREIPGPGTALKVVMGLGVLSAAGAGGLLARKIYRRRKCARCKREMFQLDEVADDAHLDEGQQTEERINSVNYDVLICRGCQDTRVLRHGRWFSGRSKCDACGYKTESRTSKTIAHASYTSGGVVRITETCAHCKRSHSYDRRTAKLSPPSTSSSSGSSSRSSSYSSSSRSSSSSSSSRSSSSSSRSSGGSSRGGGAGSSW